MVLKDILKHGFSSTWERYQRLGLNANVSFRKGGPEHQYWKRKIAEEFQRRGYKVLEEYPIGGGKTIDLVAVNEKKRVAIEIETGKSDAVSNVKKALDAGFDRVICIPVDKKISQRISRVIKGLDKK